eukprot:scaffold86194_cov56-Attheya_sp.AAC.1
MNSDPDHVSDEACDDDENVSKQSVCTVKSKVVSKKKAKSKRYIPRVWMEGKKMYIRGKGELQLSNDEIYRKLQKQAKDNRNIADLAATADEVRTGSQPTLSNYFSGKQSMRNNNKKGDDAFTKSASSRSIKGNSDKESICKDDDREITSEDDDLSWVMTEYDWKAMESEPNHNCYFSDK